MNPCGLMHSGSYQLKYYHIGMCTRKSKSMNYAPLASYVKNSPRARFRYHSTLIEQVFQMGTRLLQRDLKAGGNILRRARVALKDIQHVLRLGHHTGRGWGRGDGNDLRDGIKTTRQASQDFG